EGGERRQERRFLVQLPHQLQAHIAVPRAIGRAAERVQGQRDLRARCESPLKLRLEHEQVGAAALPLPPANELQRLLAALDRPCVLDLDRQAGIEVRHVRERGRRDQQRTYHCGELHRPPRQQG